MSASTIGLITFACVFGGSLLGLVLRLALPADHLSEKSKSAVTLGMGLVGTMAALVLGLLVASAKAFYDTQSAELTQTSSSVIIFDRVLAHYGPEAKEAREMLKKAVAGAVDRMWSTDRGGPSPLEPTFNVNELLYDKVLALSPKDDAQSSLRSQALGMAISLGQTRWLMYVQGANSVSSPFLIAMIFWLSIIFVSWGLFAPANCTVIAAFFVAALSVSGALFLIMEMYTPYGGLIRMSSAPLQVVLAHLGK
jgi:hypothetical protein